MLCYGFLSRIASSVLRVLFRGSCIGGPSAFNSPFGHGSRSHNIRPLDNHLSGLSISLSSLVLSRVYRLTFLKSLVWLDCDSASNSQSSVLVASDLPLHYHYQFLILIQRVYCPSNILFIYLCLFYFYWNILYIFFCVREFYDYGFKNTEDNGINQRPDRRNIGHQVLTGYARNLIAIILTYF